MSDPLPSSAPPPGPAPSRSVPAWVGFALLGIALVLLLKLGKSVALPVAVAVMMTFVLATPVRGLQRAGVPPPLGAGLVLVALLGTLLLFGSTLVAPAAVWWERAPANLQQLMEAIERLRAALPGGAGSSGPDSAELREQLRTEGLLLTRVVLGELWQFLISGAATVILLYFMLASEQWLVDCTVRALRQRRTRVLVLSGMREAQRDIGRFLGTMTLLNIGLGVATALVLHPLGLPNPILWGTLAAVLNFIFYIGPVLMTVLLLLAGISTFSSAALMLAPAFAFLVLNAIESNLVGPWLMGRRLRLNPVFVFLSVMLWGWIWGMAGALIAVPMLLGLRAVARRVPRLRLLRNYISDPRDVHDL
ncbi:AI-2E family transporter [Aquabacterium sp. A7-Y]|uniref:AI-2E family transporter n=1 Tax=Aquabacterium sp. A7-Y TaxID=1349605 RepID=UPI00223D9C56|nr:AI-2E family transporter [Aquabacterium sp. A7-Y]MCW7536331.1 AI-2E family transporter [Aquabacterium sp. A7-Y]